MQSSHVAKQYHELVASFQKGSFGHIFMYAENDAGLVKGGFKGSLQDKEKIKAFLNLRGNFMRIRIYLISHIDHSWVLKDLAIGFLVTKLVA